MTLLASPWGYLLPAAYLSAVTLYPRKIPTWAHLFAALVGTTVSVALAGPEALWSILGAGATFVFLVFLGVLSRTSTIAISVALASLPISAWLAFLPGMIAATLVSLVRLRRTGGAGYLTHVAADTYEAVGLLGAITGTGGLTKPDRSRIPLPDASMSSDSNIARAQRVRVRLLGYLASGLALCAVLSALNG